jgi:hypothetical protein
LIKRKLSTDNPSSDGKVDGLKSIICKKSIWQLIFNPKTCNAVYFKQDLDINFMFNIYYEGYLLASICEFLVEIS